MVFKLNMTDKEAEFKDFEYPPSGNYFVRITDLELGEVSKPGDNFGKPFWKLTLVVEEGKYEGRTIPTTVMLFDGALVSLKQLCEAVHPEFIEGSEIKLPSLDNGAPDPDPWLGQLVNIKGTFYAAGTSDKKGRVRDYDEFNVRYKKTDKSANKTSSAGLPLPS